MSTISAKAAIAFAVAALWLGHASAAAPDVDSPFANPIINSDYGPRNVDSGSYFHHGVDLAAMATTPIPVMEAGLVHSFENLRSSGGWTIRFTSIQHPGFRWSYSHMLRNSSADELTVAVDGGRFAVKVVPELTIPVLVRYTGSDLRTVETVFAPIAPTQVTIHRSTHTTSRQIVGRELIGQVGNSGTKGPHLHLSLLDAAGGKNNPMRFMRHSPMRVFDPRSNGIRGAADAAAVVTPLFPTQMAFLRRQWFPLLYGAHIKSLDGLDFDRLDLSLTTPTTGPLSLGTSSGAINLGGRDPSLKTIGVDVRTAMTTAGGLTRRLLPIGDNTGFDTIEFRDDRLALPATGLHTLDFRTSDAGGDSSGPQVVEFGVVDAPTVTISTTQATTVFNGTDFTASIPVTARSDYPALKEVQLWSVRESTAEAALDGKLQTFAASGNEFSTTLVLAGSSGAYSVIAKDEAGVHFGASFSLSSMSFTGPLALAGSPTTQFVFSNILDVRFSTNAVSGDPNFWVPASAPSGEVTGRTVVLSEALEPVTHPAVAIGGFLQGGSMIGFGPQRVVITDTGWRQIDAKLRSGTFEVPGTAGGPVLETFVRSSNDPALADAAFTDLDRAVFSRVSGAANTDGLGDPTGPFMLKGIGPDQYEVLTDSIPLRL